MKLIDKEKVMSILQDKIADIELDMKCGFLKKRKGVNNILVLKHIISLIDTIEVKKVDLEKESLKWVEEHQGPDGVFSCIDFAKHFFELGLKVQKGE